MTSIQLITTTIIGKMDDSFLGLLNYFILQR